MFLQSAKFSISHGQALAEFSSLEVGHLHAAKFWCYQ